MGENDKDHDVIEVEAKKAAAIGYQSAVALWTYEGGQNWDRFNVMLVANSIVIAVLGLVFTSDSGLMCDLQLLIASLLLSIVGLILSGTWFLITMRGFDYQEYYVHCARELEEKHLGRVVKTTSRGAKFSKGKPVDMIIGGEVTQLEMSRWSKFCTAARLSRLVIFVFAIVYLLALLHSIFLIIMYGA